jgi:K+-transporting ATPase ATPase C chain
MLKELRASFTLFALLMAVTGVAYPMLTFGAGQALFPRQANGSLIEDNGKIVGAALIGQNFTGDGYFHPRPSAAGNGYDAANSGGSNVAVAGADFAKAVGDRVAALKQSGETGGNVPVDLVTTSASGLDPDISVAAAKYQAARVAAARHMDVMTVENLIAAHTQERAFDFLGEPRVNVLEINRALDGLTGKP